MRFSRLYALAASFALLAGTAHAQTSPVSIQFQNGMVSVSARNVPLRTILQEWSRVGRTTIVNAERVTGAPVTIELSNVPEQEALATLLRGVTGYIVGARQVLATGPSSFDRIMIMPGTATVAARSSAPPPPPAPPPSPITFVPGQPDDDPQDAAAARVTAQQLQNQIRESNARAAANRVEPEGDAPARPPTTPAPTATPGNPFFSGVSGRPGEVTPVPQQPRNPLRPNGDPEP